MKRFGIAFIILAIMAGNGFCFKSPSSYDEKRSKFTTTIKYGPNGTNSLLPGELIVDMPTIYSLGFRWFIEGDDNSNAECKVYFRKKGQVEWKEALPMMRVNREVVNSNMWPFQCGNLFAGSLLNLEPNTEYEVRFVMNDPDGGGGEKVVSATTKVIPEPYKGERVVHLYPHDFTGTKTEPSFPSLSEAAEKAQIGDVVLIHKGLYYGPIQFKISGTKEKPIVFRNAGDGEVIIDGKNTGLSVIDAQNKKDYLAFEGLTIRNGRYGILASASNYLVVRNCKIEDVNFGIMTHSLDTEGWYISDNLLIGRYTSWYPRDPYNYNDEGINIAGKGHIVCYNRIMKFGDGIAPSDIDQKAFVQTPGLATMTSPPQVAMDIYNNDILESMDDGIEVDYTMHNIRVWNNRIVNSFCGISAQPMMGGPSYWWNNLIYNATYSPLKLHNSPAGLFIANNTCIASAKGFDSEESWMNTILRNNLFLGGGILYTLETGSPHPLTSLDYNGYNKTTAPYIIKWTPDMCNTWYRYKTVKEFYDGMSHEEHGFEITYDEFIKVSYPETGKTYSHDEFNFSLKNESKAVDGGVFIPTITEDFTGKAPDLGALELGKPMPIYGPRPMILLDKKADKNNAYPGGTITYTITYKNEGQGTATDVVIIEVLPENVKLSTVHSPQAEVSYWYESKWQSNFSESATKIKWIIPEILPGSSGNVSFIVKIK